MRKPALIKFSLFLLIASCFSQDSKKITGSIRGAVFTNNASGAAIVISNAHVQIQGPVAKETRSDAAGNFVFEALPAGKYEVTGTAPGLSDAAEVTVIAGTTSLTSLDLAVEFLSSGVDIAAYTTPSHNSLQNAFCKFRLARRSEECEKQR